MQEVIVLNPFVVGKSAHSANFSNSDLSSGVLTVSHNLNRQYVIVAVYDNNDSQVIPDAVTATNANSCDIDLSGFGTLTGTWNIVII